ncbi:MAG: hypothetical protein ACYDHN_14705 [Solirubrobacteraceae bacterium]
MCGKPAEPSSIRAAREADGDSAALQPKEGDGDSPLHIERLTKDDGRALILYSTSAEDRRP